MIDPRIKEIYRRLVRRLHPDLRANGDATVSSLWHEVQEAYAAGETYFPEELQGTVYYRPVPRGLEIKIAEKLKHLRELDKRG